MSETQESLSSILSGSSPATDVKPAAEPAAATPSVAKEPAETTEKPAQKAEKPDQARDESGKFAKAEKPEEKQPEKPRADVAAIMDERRKRQALEQRIRELEGTQKPKEKPSVFDNEDAAIASRVDERTGPMAERLFRQSMKIARLTYGDSFAEAEQAFAEAAERDERLVEAWRNADDPGEYVYTVGLQIKELADVGGDFVKYREKVTGDLKGQLSERDARIKALEAEVESLKKAQTDLESIPSSLNGATSGPSPKVTDADADSLTKIVRFGNH